jgi:hypothetical protein
MINVSSLLENSNFSSKTVPTYCSHTHFIDPMDSGRTSRHKRQFCMYHLLIYIRKIYNLTSLLKDIPVPHYDFFRSTQVCIRIP